LPIGLVGLLISIEVAAYTSTLSALINWGGSFIINDIYRPLDPNASARREIWVSRLTTLILFIAASIVAILYVKRMDSWFKYINFAMVMFFLPLSVFRFLWWRFNVWGELTAMLLGLPLSILVWFTLGFQDNAKHPMWQGLGLLLGLSFLTLVLVTLLTPAESPETLKRFYQRCRPPGFWGPARDKVEGAAGVAPLGQMAWNCLLGILVCLGIVLATNAVYLSDWTTTSVGLMMVAVCGSWLVRRVIRLSSGEFDATASFSERTNDPPSPPLAD